MRVTPFILATRAVSSEFIRREYINVLWIIGFVLVALHLLGIWLITQSAWWWILEIFFIFATTIIVAVAAVVVLLVNKLRPRQTKSQRKLVGSFVDSLQQIAETAQTPKFLLLFRFIRDTISPSQDSMVRQLTNRSTSLKPDFHKIIQSFDK